MSTDQENLYKAIAQGNTAVVLDICEHHPELSGAWRQAEIPTPLHGAIGHPDIIRILLAAGADPDMINSDEERLNALHLACRAGDLPTVQLFLAHGADLEARSHLGTPLHLAVTGASGGLPASWRGIVEALLDAGADIHATVDPDTDGWTPLHQACNEGYLEAVQVLLERGARVNFGKDGLTPLLIAESNDFSEILALLKAAGGR